MTGNRKIAMEQFGSGLNVSTWAIRKTEFLEDLERVVPRAVAVQIVASHYPEGKIVLRGG